MTSLSALLVLILMADDGSLSRFPQGLVSWSDCLTRTRDIAIENLIGDLTRTPYKINNARVIAATCERDDGE